MTESEICRINAQIKQSLFFRDPQPGFWNWIRFLLRVPVLPRGGGKKWYSRLRCGIMNITSVRLWFCDCYYSYPYGRFYGRCCSGSVILYKPGQEYKDLPIREIDHHKLID